MVEIALIVVLITQAAKVREHIWAGYDHTHPMRKPVLPTIPASDGFHVASFLSHYPACFMLLYMSEVSYSTWILVALGAQLIWWQAKRSEGKNWPNKIEQLVNFIRRR